MSDVSTLPPPAQEVAEQRTPLPPVRLTLPTFPEPPARPQRHQGGFEVLGDVLVAGVTAAVQGHLAQQAP